MKPFTVETSDGLTLSCLSAGDKTAETGILFLHGILQAGLTFKHQLAEPMFGHLHLVAPDLRGHGFSSKPVGARYYHDGTLWAADAERILNAAGMSRAILVGWSYGGRVILDAMEHRPRDGRIAGLVFVDANTKSVADHTTSESVAALAGALDMNMSRNIAARRDFVSLCFEQMPSEPDIAEILAYNQMTPPEVLAGLMGRPLERDCLMARLELPTLVIHGSRDRLCRPLCAEHTAATIPGAELVMLEGIGHTPHLEDSDRFNRLLAEFVDIHLSRVTDVAR